jgi:ribosome-binding protein aMBF1 (putative translation factor)
MPWGACLSDGSASHAPETAAASIRGHPSTPPETSNAGHNGIVPRSIIARTTAAQIRAGRALLGWSAAQLAQAAGVSWKTVQRAEAGQGVPRMTVTTLEKVQGALEAAGVSFIPADGALGPGVRLGKPAP